MCNPPTIAINLSHPIMFCTPAPALAATISAVPQSAAAVVGRLLPCAYIVVQYTPFAAAPELYAGTTAVDTVTV